MKTFYNADLVLMTLAAGGLIAFGKNIVEIVRYAYQRSLTPEGAAALRLITALMVATCLVLLLGHE